MSPRHIWLLLPCHSLEDFPMHHEGLAAEGLLVNWSAPWHPALIAAGQAAPSWRRVDDLASDAAGKILLLPTISREEAPADLEDQCTTNESILLADATDRTVLVDQLKQQLARLIEPADAALLNADVNAELVGDFYALGYWYLQIELLTRQMRYTSHLDRERFCRLVLEAAQLACQASRQEAEDKLGQCFSLLADERDHYYPVDAYLLDLALIADTTTDAAIERELDCNPNRSFRKNLWMTGQTANLLAVRNPRLAQRIAARVTAEPTDRSDALSVVGGERRQLPTPLVSNEAVLAELISGIQALQSQFGTRPTVFFRRRFGLSPLHPGLLKRMGWTGAVHATLDAGQFPKCGQTRSRWEGPIGSGIDAFGNLPVDASRPETFLRLALRMGESMERDYVAAVCLAHWCGDCSHWIDELQRGDKYGLRLGKLATFEEFFTATDYNSHTSEHRQDQYKAPYLVQAVAAGEKDPISRWVRWWRNHMTCQATEALATWAAVLGARRSQLPPLATVDAADVCHDTNRPLVDDLQQAAQAVAERIVVDGADSDSESTVLDAQIVLNTINAPQDIVVEQSLVSVPAAGYAWHAADQPIEANSDGVVVKESTIRNAFCDVHVDPSTGALRAVYDFRTRGNRLSQRLVHRKSGSTEMICDSIQSTVDADLGEIQSAGRLVHEDQTLATFRQSFGLRRNSRLLRITIEIDPQVDLTPQPWRDYFACRWAWSQSDASLHRTVLGLRHETSAKRCESPVCLEIHESHRKTAILPGGLPYHHRASDRMLDSLLLVAGESASAFELAVGFDLPLPLHTAANVMTPPIVAPGRTIDRQLEPASRSGCFFHVDARHLLMTGWQPLWAQDESALEDPSGEPNCVGFRVRLLETLGKAGQATLRAPRRLVSACKTDFLGKEVSEVNINDGCAEFNFGACEWTEVECRW